ASWGGVVRLRARGLLLHGRDRCIRQADAAAMALARIRRRDGRRLFRTIPVLSTGGGAYRPRRLAADARHLRGRRAPDYAALARARSVAAGWREDSGNRTSAAIGGAGAQRGARPQELRAPRARLPHLRLPDLLHRRASARLSG